MSDTLIYQYTSPSVIQKTGTSEELFLSKFSEIEKADVPCFFWGKLTEPYLTARCLITLSNVVQSSFNLSPFELAKLKDPVVTAGNNKIRFEGFSHCAGVYARVDILPEGHDGEFLANGTTNVDFNQPMISALSRIQRNENLVLSVGKKEISVHSGAEKIVERKVPLPAKWIKGMASVQVYMSQSEKAFTFNRVQALQLFQSIPAGKPKSDYFLIVRGNKPSFSAVKSHNAICVGGIHRLKLIEPLVALCDELKVFPHPAIHLECHLPKIQAQHLLRKTLCKPRVTELD